MFFRFACGLILVVLVSMLGIALEKQTLEMNRAVSRQYFQIDLLLELHAGLRLSIQQKTAPALLADAPVDQAATAQRFQRVPAPASPAAAGQPPTDRRNPLPLMRWQLPPRQLP